MLQVAHKRRRMALLTIEDATEVFCLRAALDASEYAALVVDARGRVLAFNKLAVGLFGSVEVGADAAQLLPQPAAGQRLWDPGLTARRKMHIEIGPRIYQAHEFRHTRRRRRRKHLHRCISSGRQGGRGRSIWHELDHAPRAL